MQAFVNDTAAVHVTIRHKLQTYVAFRRIICLMQPAVKHELFD